MTQPTPPLQSDPSGDDAPLDIADDPILGAVIANYPSDRVRLALLGGGAYALCGAVLNAAFWSVDAATASIVVIGGMAVLALGIGWALLHVWNSEVVVYERGFSYREGSNLAHILFHEVRSIHLRAERVSYFGGLAKRTVRRFTLVTVHDERVLLDSRYRRVDELLDRLDRAILPHLRANFETTLAAGGAADFGAGLGLSNDGLLLADRALSWADFGGYALGGGQLTLRGRSGEAWAALPLTGLVNLTLLIEMLRARAA
jgi:hypothetical protein